MVSSEYLFRKIRVSHINLNEIWKPAFYPQPYLSYYQYALYITNRVQQATRIERHDESFLSNNITLFGYDIKCVNCKSYIASFHSCCSELLLSYVLQVFPYQRNCIISPLILPGASFPRILWSKLYSFTATQPVILRAYVYTMYRFLPKVVCKKCIERRYESL